MRAVAAHPTSKIDWRSLAGNLSRVLDLIPQLVGNRGLAALRDAIAEPDRYAIEPKVDGVRGLVVFLPDRTVETRNRHGVSRDWLRGDAFEAGLRRLAERLPILWDGTVLDGELIAGRFAGTMAALHGSRRFRDELRFVAFDVPFLAGVELRPLPWEERRERLELLSKAFEPPFVLSPVVTPDPALAEAMIAGEMEGLVLKDRRSTYRDGSRVGWQKVKDAGWYERERWRFDRR
jgi:bifunctional non-homologous end joining protein LigD